ncbi:hypothetical protein O6P43_014937 [Quillaja saponaria]|uniref:Uncharacterized protein n=1 Tax=Quillaja saponaria TaxID=32244 RepID=A0AAD7PSA4_QUISA|nr:hypothetical protein O6P43_014937 [Quillaja saponaria]
MGNCFVHCIPSSESSISGYLAKQDRVVRVVKQDGKVMEFCRPTFVKDILMVFSASGIGISKEASDHLPPDYELKRGTLYYMLPSITMSSAGTSCPANTSYEGDTEQAGGIKRIKVVITKQQLQELVTKQISLEELLSQAKNSATYSADLPTNWKPKLDSIPE